MLFNKKISVLATAIVVFCSLAGSLAGVEEIKDSGCKEFEIRYRCYLETANPIWHILFFLTFSSRDFIFKEKTARDAGKCCREAMILNENIEIARLVFSKGVFKGSANIGTKYWEAEFNPEQAKSLFEILDFIRAAKPGFAYNGNFQNRKSLYWISVNAVREEVFEISRETLTAIYFEGEVWKKSEKYLQARFWVARGGTMDGQIIKFVFKKPHLPTIILEIADKN
jgi:hypothetical protein